MLGQHVDGVGSTGMAPSSIERVEGELEIDSMNEMGHQGNEGASTADEGRRG